MFLASFSTMERTVTISTLTVYIKPGGSEFTDSSVKEDLDFYLKWAKPRIAETEAMFSKLDPIRDKKFIEDTRKWFLKYEIEYCLDEDLWKSIKDKTIYFKKMVGTFSSVCPSLGWKVTKIDYEEFSLVLKKD